MGAIQSKEMKKALRLLAEAEAVGAPITQVEAAQKAGLKSSSGISRQLKKTTGKARKYEKSQKLDTTL